MKAVSGNSLKMFVPLFYLFFLARCSHCSIKANLPDPKQHLDRPLRLYVYNHEYNITRTLTISPSRHWGGSGALGCVLGFGALHRLPAPLQEPPQAPGETLFESVRLSHESSNPSPNATSTFLIPASQPLPPPVRAPSRGAPAQKHKQRVHHHHPGSAMEDYFREGEQRSKEEDHALEPKAGKGIAPPPKAGGPPPRSAAASPEKGIGGEGKEQ